MKNPKFGEVGEDRRADTEGEIEALLDDRRGLRSAASSCVVARRPLGIIHTRANGGSDMSRPMNRAEEITARAKMVVRSDEALQRLREDMTEDGSFDTLLDKCGDLAARVAGAHIEAVAGNDLLIAAGLEKRLGALRNELTGPEPSPLEITDSRPNLLLLAGHAAGRASRTATSGRHLRPG